MISRSLLVPALFASSALVACAPPPAPPKTPTPDEVRQSLERADLDFADATARRGVDGWVDWFAEDGAQYDSKGHATRGKAAIRAEMTPVFADVRILWKPVFAAGAREGDLGFTYGTYEVKPKDKDEIIARGAYMTVWRRAPDGTWKVLADMGSKDR